MTDQTHNPKEWQLSTMDSAPTMTTLPGNKGVEMLTICNSPGWLAPPAIERPRCSNNHRERYMKWYRREKIWRCQKCGAALSEQENLDRPINAAAIAKWEKAFDYEMAEDAAHHFTGWGWELPWTYSDKPGGRQRQIRNQYANDCWSELAIEHAWWQWQWMLHYRQRSP